MEQKKRMVWNWYTSHPSLHKNKCDFVSPSGPGRSFLLYFGNGDGFRIWKEKHPEVDTQFSPLAGEHCNAGM